MFSRSGDGININDRFNPGAACPVAVDGDAHLVDGQGNVFLVNALERVADGRGDDDGLCESAEACIYSPHFGAYQGEGTLLGPCVFANGTVSDVEMWAHSTLGF